MYTKEQIEAMPVGQRITFCRQYQASGIRWLLAAVVFQALAFACVLGL